MEDLSWLGLTWDEGPDVGGPYGPYIQQERYDRYDEALAVLREKGLLYPCYCSRTRLQAIGAPHAGEHTVYDGHCYGLSEDERRRMTKKPSWRIHVSKETVSFTDSVYGRQQDDLPSSCGDFVVRRADDMYAYQLAVSVDDGSMAITHVLRGEDLLSSTAQQIWLMKILAMRPLAIPTCRCSSTAMGTACQNGSKALPSAPSGRTRRCRDDIVPPGLRRRLGP